MAQINNSQPTHPVITFLVNLTETSVNSISPTTYQPHPDQGRLDKTTFANTNSTYIPGLLDGENRILRHGQQFTLYGAKAQYYRAEIAKGNYSMLSIVSAT